MLANKSIIQSRFNRASDSYEEVAHLQKKCANTLSTLWRVFAPDYAPHTILDLGTGTGYMVDALFPFFANSEYILNDMAPNMIASVEKKWKHLPQFSFQLGDMEKMPFKDYDLIVSNFALQWANEVNSLLKKCYYHSDYFVFSTLLSGTFQEWETLLSVHNVKRSMPFYPCVCDLKIELLALKPEKYHFLVQEFKITFENPAEFVMYLKKLGAGSSKTTLSFRQSKVFNHFVKHHQQPLTVTYQVFLGLLKRGK